MQAKEILREHPYFACRWLFGPLTKKGRQPVYRLVEEPQVQGPVRQPAIQGGGALDLRCSPDRHAFILAE